MLSEIALVFLRIGCLGFGGPIATMAMMEEETCRRRGWITDAQYSEMYAITKLLPGPVAAQLAIFIGKTRAGIAGGIIAGLAFVLPSFLLVLVLSMVYVRSGQVSGAHTLLSGFQIGALVVILLSVEQMSRAFRKQRISWAIALGSAGLIFLHPRWEPLIILSMGLLGAWRGSLAAKNQTSAGTANPTSLKALAVLPVAAWAHQASPQVLSNLFWTCFKAGAFVFGTGLAIVPLLEGDAVNHFHWVTHGQFMDGLAIGQVTPGPVVITVTFIGYLAAGWLGALVATAGVLLPPFINVLFLVPLFWARWSGTPSSQGFSKWAIPAVIGGILGTTLRLGLATVVTPWQVTLLVVLFGIAYWRKPPAWVLIPVAGAASLLAGFFGA